MKKSSLCTNQSIHRTSEFTVEPDQKSPLRNKSSIHPKSVSGVVLAAKASFLSSSMKEPSSKPSASKSTRRCFQQLRRCSETRTGHSCTMEPPRIPPSQSTSGWKRRSQNTSRLDNMANGLETLQIATGLKMFGVLSMLRSRKLPDVGCRSQTQDQESVEGYSPRIHAKFCKFDEKTYADLDQKWRRVPQKLMKNLNCRVFLYVLTQETLKFDLCQISPSQSCSIPQ